jgi:hypothetical protein
MGRCTENREEKGELEEINERKIDNKMQSSKPWVEGFFEGQTRRRE